jgi:hypothetical protein
MIDAENRENGTHAGRRKLLIIGDSSALPREGVPYEDTYFYMLKKALDMKYDILNLSSGGNNSRRVARDIDSFVSEYSPEIVILNYGIVDAYPRPFPYWLSQVFRLVNLSPDGLLKTTGLYYTLGELFNFKIVTLRNFRRYTERVMGTIKKSGAGKIVIVGIIRAHGKILRSRIAEREFTAYNQCLAGWADGSSAHFIDMSLLSEDAVIWDGYHYNQVASKHLAEKVLAVIKEGTE